MTNIKSLAKNTIFALVAFAATLPITSTAQAGGYDAGYHAFVDGVSDWDVLNMRKWPANHSKKVAAIPDNGWGIWVERCIYKEDASDWCKVKYANQWGWVNKRYITEYQY